MAHAPKYAPWVSLLAEDRAHFRRASAPAYWRLAPHYIGQFSEASCSLAAATMVLNGLRGGLAAERLLTQADILAAVGDEIWRANVQDGGRGATGRELAGYLWAGLAALGLDGAGVAACPVTTPGAAAGSALRAALAEVEAGRLLLIAHVHMATMIGDGEYGHFSPVGAYDAEADRALILDVYRVTYEPYWVPFERLLAAMAIRDRAKGEPRGYLTITVPAGS